MENPTDQRETWRDSWKRAHEFACKGRSDEALPIYMRASDIAKEAKHWADVAHLMHDAGNAAADIGQFEYAKSLYAISLIFAERADLPPIEALGTRIEKARVEMIRGRPEILHSDVTTLVRDARSLYEHDARSTESPDLSRPTAKRYLAAALDLRRQHASFFRQWRVCQQCLDEMETLTEESSEERAFIRLAQVDLQIEKEQQPWNSIEIFEKVDDSPILRELATKCLKDFQRLGSIVGEARTWHVLAKIEMRAHDDFLAIEYASRGFSLVPTIVDPYDCAILYDDVAMSWRRLERFDKAGEHWLAAVVIRLATGISWQRSLKTLRQHRKGPARSVRRSFGPCSIINLIEKTDFFPLGRFLQSLNVSIEVIQERVDQILRDDPGDPEPSSPGKPPTPAAPAAAAAVFLDEFPMPSQRKKID